METYMILRDLAIILIAAKFFGLVARKCKAPQVVGQIVAGLVIGPCMLGWVQQSDFILQLAEIGVILVMFSAGLTTDLKKLVKTGPVAFAVACIGVFVPLALGTILYMSFYGFAPWGSTEFIKAVFIGTIMTATSVGITVATLQEMGKIKTELGTMIVSAAIIDDVIGIVVLSLVLSMRDPSNKVSTVLIHTVLFFAVAAIGGFIMYHVFKWVDQRYPHTRRIPIISIAYCFALSYIAERYFGIADITGAFIAGITICSIQDAPYVEQKVDINTYIIFGPIFFASIGLKTNFSDMNAKLLLFSVCFVLVALLGKIIGCGAVAKLSGHSWGDALKVGVGMMTRGEVALIVTQKGLSAGVISADYFTAVILLIIISSVLTPILLKLLYAKDDGKVRQTV